MLGGDWLWIANVLGYTGPKGVHFCKDCLCKLSDLQKGMTHSPSPLPKYNESTTPSVCNFEKRTFEQLQADHERYRASGDPRTKVKDYHNCELPSLFKGSGPIILTTSCMPLHISLGVGLRILNVVEKEAISIDNEIKTENGQQTNEISEIMNRLQILSSEVLEKGEQLQNVADQLEQKNSNVKDFEVKHELELEKMKGVMLIIQQKLENYKKNIKNT